MKRSRIAPGIAILLTSLALSACGSSDEITIADDCTPIVQGVKTGSDGKLSISVAEYPPYVTHAKGKLSGIDGEVLTEVARQLCLQPDVKTQSFTAVIESVKNGSADLSAGNWYINDERQQQFEVSDPVYADEMAIVSQDGFDNLTALEGKTVGTTQGYLWVEDLQSALGKKNVKLYQTEDAAFQDVKVGRIDAAVITYGGGTQLLKTYKGDDSWLASFAPDERVGASVDTATTAVLVHKGNAKLQEAVNTVVSSMRQNGELAKILTKNGLPESAARVD